MDKPSRPIIDYCKRTVSSTQLAHELRYNDNNEDKGIQKPLQIDCARAIQNACFERVIYESLNAWRH